MKNEILKEYSTISQFAEKVKINRSIFSLIFRKNSRKPISFAQLTKITLALGYREEHFFSLYINECFFEGKPNRSRIEPFLIRCAELHCQPYMDQVLFRLGTNYSEQYWPLIFEISEKLVRTLNKNHIFILLNWLVKYNVNQKPEHIAIVYYRIFRISLGEDNAKNLRTALRFEPHLQAIPDELRLDALLQLTNIYFNLAKWKEVEGYADELRALAENVYFTHQSGFSFSTDRHPVVYYGQSYLQKGNALEHQHLYDESVRYISKYEDLSWFPNLDNLGHTEVQKFSHWAEANRLNLAILKGDHSVLDEYTAFLERHPHEIFPSLLTIMESANQYNFCVCQLLDKFKAFIMKETEGNYYGELFNLNRRASLYCRIAIYYAKRKHYEDAEQFAALALTLSEELNNTQHFRMLASLSVSYLSGSLEDDPSRSQEFDLQ
ncbi:hypothetical protein QWJ34_10260 [Saccharibacillus sp. CPCC 101409]|uniref:hypothetical protein n=1 Tax=Saccharibacillus sp. CPCC 101409 TaxID=3058041 RepID=UPI002672E6AC|nr:hypothetical protein [Saccharibacillus sp. CPCC 101409]MDO3410144.1 hypothetical protein [Saccharibacillus sp. CPCC 101409]